MTEPNEMDRAAADNARVMSAFDLSHAFAAHRIAAEERVRAELHEERAMRADQARDYADDTAHYLDKIESLTDTLALRELDLDVVKDERDGWRRIWRKKNTVCRGLRKVCNTYFEERNEARAERDVLKLAQTLVIEPGWTAHHLPGRLCQSVFHDSGAYIWSGDRGQTWKFSTGKGIDCSDEKYERAEAMRRALAGTTPFQECENCRVKPGAPILCDVCLAARAMGQHDDAQQPATSRPFRVGDRVRCVTDGKLSNGSECYGIRLGEYTVARIYDLGTGPQLTLQELPTSGSFFASRFVHAEPEVVVECEHDASTLWANTSIRWCHSCGATQVCNRDWLLPRGAK